MSEKITGGFGLGELTADLEGTGFLSSILSWSWGNFAISAGLFILAGTLGFGGNVSFQVDVIAGAVGNVVSRWSQVSKFFK